MAGVIKIIPKEITLDLRNGSSLEETLIKYNTNLKDLFSSSKYVPGIITEWTYIYPTKSNTFRVSKKINGHTSYKTHADALIVRDKLMECNWDKSKLSMIYEKCGVCPLHKGGI